jgi:hypothetical protein
MFFRCGTGSHRMFSLMEHRRAAPPTVLPGIKRVIFIIHFINRTSRDGGVHPQLPATWFETSLAWEAAPISMAPLCARPHMQSGGALLHWT